MVGHYIVSAFRTFRQSKAVTLINILCLALGLAAFIVSYAVVRYWETGERHFTNANRIYAISTDFIFPNGEPPINTLATAEHVAKYLKIDFPEIEAAVRVRSMGDTAVSTGTEKVYIQGVAADPDFLKAFDLKFVAGNPATALSQPRSALITEAVALRLFGTVDAIGKPALLDGLTDVTIAGVIEAIPKSSNFNFELLATWDVHEAYMRAINPRYESQPAREEWRGNVSASTYVLLPLDDGKARAKFLAEMKTFGERHIPEEQRTFENIRFNAIPFTGLQVARLDQTLFSNIKIGVSITKVLLILGGLILAIACINYGNLSAAQAAERFKEIGTHRVLGASPRQVFVQSISLTAVHTIAAFILALLVAYAISPLMERTLDIDIEEIIATDLTLWTFVPGLLIAVTSVAGSYAAICSARVTPGRALRASNVADPIGVRPTLLIAIQFMAASILLVGVIVMNEQTAAIRKIALGTRADSVVLVGNNLNDARISFDTYKTAHGGYPQIQSVSASSLRPWGSTSGMWIVSRAPDMAAERFSAIIHFVEQDFFRTLDIPVLGGRVLDKELVADVISPDGVPFNPSQPNSIVIDRTFALNIGFSNPAGAVDSLLYIPAERDDPWRPFRIVGVVEDKPLYLQTFGAVGNIYQLGERTQVPLLRVAANDIPGALRAMEEVWQKLAPNIPLDVRFLDATFDQGYKPFNRIYYLLNGLVVLAVGIAIAGLIAMAIHEMHRRFHEIAVRKTLGARTFTIAWKLLRGFSMPVLIGNLIAWPLAYLAAQSYLSMFMYRIDVSLWPFVLSLVITLLVAWAAIGFQTLRAARLNPATVLRYE